MRKIIFASLLVMGLFMFASGDTQAAPGGHCRGKSIKTLCANELRLPAGKTAVSKVIFDPGMGDKGEFIKLELRAESLSVVPASLSSVASSAVAVTTYGRTCTWYVSDPSGGTLWQLGLRTRWYYNYVSVLYQDPSYVGSKSVFPYSWSNKSWWNSRWSSTVVFADGIGDLHVNIPVPNFYSVTKHLYIGGDAWGNCWGGWYNG